jgi:hypothetical protein
MRTLGIVVLGLALSCCAFLISGITSAYSGTFYTTGKEFYEGCWQRKTKEKKEGSWKLAVAATPSEAALWASCTPLVAQTMISIGFELSSSGEKAPAEMKALVGFCPNAWSELPTFPDLYYIPIIEIIEKTGGPSATENLAPASWVIQRARVGLAASTRRVRTSMSAHILGSILSTTNAVKWATEQQASCRGIRRKSALMIGPCWRSRPQPSWRAIRNIIAPT